MRGFHANTTNAVVQFARVNEDRYAGDVKDVTTSNFGLLIAFVLPGFVLLWGIAPYSQTVTHWLAHANSDAPTVGGFLYVTLASVGLGQLVSTLRWLLIDSLHHRTGITPPAWSFRELRSKEASGAFERLVDDHYRFYQFHANGFVALTLAFLTHGVATGFSTSGFVAVVLCDVLLFVGSRDTLSRYYRRAEQVLAPE